MFLPDDAFDWPHSTTTPLRMLDSKLATYRTGEK